MKSLLIFLFVVFFTCQFVSAQDLSTEIRQGNIENIIKSTNGAHNGIVLIDDVKLFPNPSKGYINLKINNEIDAPLLIHVYNTSGEMYQTMEINKDNSFLEYSVSVADLPSGLYFVEIKLGEIRAIKKLQKL